MSTAPSFTTIPPEVRLLVYEYLLHSHMPEAENFFSQPAYSLYLAGTSPFTRHVPDPTASRYYSPWALLRVCQLVRRELQPLLNNAGENGQIVYEFQAFTVKDMRAWAAAAGEARVAAMRRWSFDVIIDCTAEDMGTGSDDNVSESESEAERADLDLCLERMTRLYERRNGESEGNGEGRDERDADEDGNDGEEGSDGDYDDEFGSYEKFHVVSLNIDLNRLFAPGHAGEPDEGSDLNGAERVHEWYWGADWYEDRCEGCKDFSSQGAYWFMQDELLQGVERPRVITGEFLCSMLDELSQNACNSKARRKDWAMFRHRIDEFGCLD